MQFTCGSAAAVQQCTKHISSGAAVQRRSAEPPLQHSPTLPGVSQLILTSNTDTKLQIQLKMLNLKCYMETLAVRQLCFTNTA